MSNDQIEVVVKDQYKYFDYELEKIKKETKTTHSFFNNLCTEQLKQRIGESKLDQEVTDLMRQNPTEKPLPKKLSINGSYGFVEVKKERLTP